MGQSWQVINLDKGQTLGSWGKLGECLFSGLPDTLVHVLEQATEPGLDEAPCWIGDRIICLGNYHNDLPTGLLSPEEQAELDEVGDDYSSLYYFARETYLEMEWPYYNGRQDSQMFVLRNLSKNEYVREEVIRCETLRGRRIQTIGLGEVLLSRISWSTDNSCSMSYHGDIHRGV
jgi:hypothetical protein